MRLIGCCSVALADLPERVFAHPDPAESDRGASDRGAHDRGRLAREELTVGGFRECCLARMHRAAGCCAWAHDPNGRCG